MVTEAAPGNFGGEDILLDAIEAGRPADFIDCPAPRRRIRAYVLRDLLRGSLVKELDPAGAHLIGARVAGRLDLSGVEVPVGLFLRDCTFGGTVNLCDAHIPSLSLTGCEIADLEADGLRIERALSAERLTCNGSIRMIGASIGDQASFISAKIINAEVTALLADGIEVNGDLLLSAGFQAVSRSGSAVRLLGAHIRGDVDCDDGSMTSIDEIALNAEYIKVDGSVRLQRFRCNEERGYARVHGGAVSLKSGHIGGELRCEDARLNGGDKCALMADGLQVDGDMYLSWIRAYGNDPDGTIRLRGAHVAGHFYCNDATAEAPTAAGVAIDLSFARIGMALSLRGGFAEPGHQSKIRLDGMSYTAVPDGMDRRAWVRLLAGRMPAYAAHPYQQLASVYRAAGQEDDARAVLIAQMDHLRRQARSRLTHIRLLLLKIAVGYGYQSWRALIGLALTLACAITFVLWAAHTTHAVRALPPTAARADATPRRCTLADQIGLGFDLAIPLINTTTRQRCNIIGTSQNDEWLEAASWLFQLAGWSFATLFVAGYTGFIRKG